MATFAPFCANAAAIALPMPVPPPVTKAILPVTDAIHLLRKTSQVSTSKDKFKFFANVEISVGWIV
jgi:hypothetical protein